ncbi:hypothetical protein GCM10011329_06420 [Stakelama pacifica]|nr:hypothetical protein GCM10011329_06420 [Stakelama pacifica]
MPSSLSWDERALQLFRERLDRPGFAFPNRQYTPASIDERLLLIYISLNIAVEFLAPKFDARLRHGCLAATGMAVPETAVNEDRRLMLRQYDIRSARQSTTLESETKSKPMQKLANDQFRPGVRSSDRTHDATSGRIDRIVKVWRAA